MADGPALARNVTTTSEDFRGIAETAGLQLQAAMTKDMESVTQTSGFAPFPIEDYQNVLEGVMKHFATKVFKDRHPGGKLDWVKIFVSVQDIPYDDKNASSEMVTNDKREGAWFLALAVGEHGRGKIGCSFSLLKRFNVEKFDTYLGYKVL